MDVSYLGSFRRAICLFSTHLAHSLVCSNQYGLRYSEFIFRTRREGVLLFVQVQRPGRTETADGHIGKLLASLRETGHPSHTRLRAHDSELPATRTSQTPTCCRKGGSVCESPRSSRQTPCCPCQCAPVPLCSTPTFKQVPNPTCDAHEHAESVSREQRGPRAHSTASRTDLYVWWCM